MVNDYNDGYRRLMLGQLVVGWFVDQSVGLLEDILGFWCILAYNSSNRGLISTASHFRKADSAVLGAITMFWQYSSTCQAKRGFGLKPRNNKWSNLFAGRVFFIVCPLVVTSKCWRKQVFQCQAWYSNDKDIVCHFSNVVSNQSNQRAGD